MRLCRKHRRLSCRRPIGVVLRLAVVLATILAVLAGPIETNLAVAAPTAGSASHTVSPCHMGADEAGQVASAKMGTADCQSMDGAICLTLVGILAPTPRGGASFPPAALPAGIADDPLIDRQVTPPDRPPKTA